MSAIERTPGKCGGRPVIRGTQFEITRLLKELAWGEVTVAELIDEYNLPPQRTRDAIHEVAKVMEK